MTSLEAGRHPGSGDGLRGLRQPRVGEMVADSLRRGILGGTYPDGSTLPTQEELRASFGVSMPSIREALRVLEAEGLVRMRRGATGGAVVRLPRAHNVAYTLGLSLHAGRTPLADLARAMERLEPVCAALCAERPDREVELIPALRHIQRESSAAVGDLAVFTRWVRRFHETLVSGCGNETVILVLGSLELLWSAHLQSGTEQAVSDHRRPATEYTPEESLTAHANLIDAIAEGRSSLAESLAREHGRAVHGDAALWVPEPGADDIVQARLLQSTGEAGRHGLW